MAKASEILIHIRDKVNLSGFQTLQMKLGNLKKKISAAFNSKPVNFFKKAVLGAVAAIAGAVAEGARFNVQMARVWTMAGGGVKNFKALRKEARGLAADFGKARSEIANGMYNALSAGVDRANLESFMKTAAQVAVADGSDISVAVDGITTVLNAFNYETDQAQDVTDLLFQTVRQGKTTFNELATSLSNTASTAASANIPLEQILAHIATLTSQGTPTAQATTQIRQAILGLNKALGDGWSATMTFQDALKTVWSQAGHSQTKLLELVGSSEAMQAVLGGVGDNAVMASEKLMSMADSAGAAEEAFEKVQQFRHWPTLLETARAALSKFGEKIDERIQPLVTAVTKQIKEWTGDKSLWETIDAVMDAAASRLYDAAAATKNIVSQINSLQDLQVVASAIGEWLKKELVEGGQELVNLLKRNAPKIGQSIGDAIVNAVKRLIPNHFGLGGDNPTLRERAGAFVQEGGWGERYYNRIDEITKQKRDKRLEEAGEALIDESQSNSLSLAELVNLRLAEARKEESLNRLAELYESGMNLEDVQTAIQNWEKSREELKALQDSIKESAATTEETAEVAEEVSEVAKETSEVAKEAVESAEEMQVATSKSMETTNQSHALLRNVLKETNRQAEQTNATSQLSIQLLERMQEIQVQQQDQLAQAFGVVNRLQQDVQNLNYQIASLKA